MAILIVGPQPAAANDSQNINRLLNNQVIVSRQIMCVLEKSPCDQLGRQLKGAAVKERKNHFTNEQSKKFWSTVYGVLSGSGTEVLFAGHRRKETTGTNKQKQKAPLSGNSLTALIMK
uniref:Uncharacterized protein n=1 Tax=Anopheles minimus TaxID=112268 RepID=A0A182W787_9DIPT